VRAYTDGKPYGPLVTSDHGLYFKYLPEELSESLAGTEKIAKTDSPGGRWTNVLIHRGRMAGKAGTMPAPNFNPFPQKTGFRGKNSLFIKFFKFLKISLDTLY
jgi:hypothetical protein